MNFFNMIRTEFKGYNLQTLKMDVLAGMTVAAVALPLALAFGVSNGANAAAGMITAILAGSIIGSLSGGFYQISGPTGAMGAILMSIVATKGLEGVMVATFLAGIFLLLAGILKIGSITSLIPAPVITGFTSGIAIIIALGQLDNFFGVYSEGHNLIEKLHSYQQFGFPLDPVTTLLGASVIIGMVIFPKSWNQKIPASLVMIILATLLTGLFNLPVATVGKIPTTLVSEQRLFFSELHLSNLKDVLVPAVSIALLGMIESLLCGASAGRMTGKELDSNQELMAQGIGNMILPFFGGVPATAAIARTSVAIKSGAQTRLTGIFHAVFLLLSMMVFAPIMSNIPMSALAGVLMVTAWRMNEWALIKEFCQKRFYPALIKFFITMIATVIFDLSLAIILGVAASSLIFLVKSAQISITSEEIDWDRMALPPVEHTKDWIVVYLSGPLFFMSSGKLKNTLDALKDKEGIILSMRGVSSIDTTALTILSDCYSQRKERGQALYFSSMQPNVKKMIETMSIDTKVHYHFSVADALRDIY